MPGTLNMYSNVRDLAFFQAAAPGWANLIVGLAYAVSVMNSTDNDITSGTMIVLGADASDTDPCLPGPFTALEPVQDCGPILSGIPYGPQVEIEITADRPIPARGVCSYAVPCPKQFMQISDVPAGCVAVIGLTRLRRTDWSHLGPYGTIPPPLQLIAPFQAPMQMQAPQQVQVQSRRSA